MSKEDDSDFNVARAELFEAMGHPNRIRILKALSERPLGFSELKRAVGMESSGLLSFHLEKLTHLVKTTAEGNYALTDDGHEALRMAETMRSNSSSVEGKRFARPVNPERVLVAGLLIGLIVVGAVAVYQQQEIAHLSNTIAKQQAGSVVVNGKAFWYLTLPYGLTSHNTSISFHGVNFTFFYHIPTGPVVYMIRNPTGVPAVTVPKTNVTISSPQQQSGVQMGQPITVYLIVPLPLTVQFPDGMKEILGTHISGNGSNTAIELPTNLTLFTLHEAPQAGISFDDAKGALTLYVSVG